jgi:hypothetical protein
MMLFDSKGDEIPANIAADDVEGLCNQLSDREAELILNDPTVHDIIMKEMKRVPS